MHFMYRLLHFFFLFLPLFLLLLLHLHLFFHLSFSLSLSFRINSFHPFFPSPLFHLFPFLLLPFHLFPFLLFPFRLLPFILSFSFVFFFYFFFGGTACTVCFQDVDDDATDCNPIVIRLQFYYNKERLFLSYL